MPRASDVIPVVDIFAGPGGLGEGFSSYRGGSRGPGFRIAASIEKDFWAHQTLELRAFRRQFDADPAFYSDYLTGRIDRKTLFAAHPDQANVAENEVHQVVLGKDTADDVRALIAARITGDMPWVLIGGPPCQAYSLIGRARNRGNSTYVAETDVRQRLYVDYLQILADHAPPVFIMENVKGLLSARLEGHQLFDRIRSDLRDPASALQREGRSARGKPKYELRSLTAPGTLFGPNEPADFLVRAEQYGIPQARHRVIIMGVREDIPCDATGLLRKKRENTAGTQIGDLPRLRSGLSGSPDTLERWMDTVRNVPKRGWFRQLDKGMREAVQESIDGLRTPAAGRGANILKRAQRVVLNHHTRSHIVPDLDRYLFAATFARAAERSPALGEFPQSLLPEHRSAAQALSGGHFADRFRVQLKGRPATTVTSHISKDGHYYIHYDASQCRSLTVREAARLQTFPDDYFFCGPRTSQYQQVGNAVPPELAQQIAGIVHQVLRG